MSSPTVLYCTIANLIRIERQNYIFILIFSLFSYFILECCAMKLKPKDKKKKN